MQKSLSIAYVLWAVLGSFGAHRFYVGQRAAGTAMLVLAGTGTVLTSLAGGPTLVAGGCALALASVWSLADVRRLRAWVEATHG